MKFFEHRPWLALLLILVLYAIVSTMDYHDEQAQVCAAQNLSYNSSEDRCE